MYSSNSISYENGLHMHKTDYSIVNSNVKISLQPLFCIALNTCNEHIRLSVLVQRVKNIYPFELWIDLRNIQKNFRASKWVRGHPVLSPSQRRQIRAQLDLHVLVVVKQQKASWKFGNLTKIMWIMILLMFLLWGSF